jgi:hypothetical protein
MVSTGAIQKPAATDPARSDIDPTRPAGRSDSGAPAGEHGCGTIRYPRGDFLENAPRRRGKKEMQGKETVRSVSFPCGCGNP